MESPTDILRKEHDQVLRVLDRLDVALKDKKMLAMKENITILEKEFDKHSLNKEEKALFPEIEKFIPRDGGPTGVMVAEHRQLTELIKNFKIGIEAKNLDKLNEVGSSIFSILRPHIDKENNMLFMMADMHLNDKQKKAISEKFRKIDSAKN